MRNGVQPVAVKVLGSTNGMPLKAMTDSDFAQEISILRACRDTNILQFQVSACMHRSRGGCSWAGKPEKGPSKGL